MAQRFQSWPFAVTVLSQCFVNMLVQFHICFQLYDLHLKSPLGLFYPRGAEAKLSSYQKQLVLETGTCSVLDSMLNDPKEFTQADYIEQFPSSNDLILEKPYFDACLQIQLRIARHERLGQDPRSLWLTPATHLNSDTDSRLARGSCEDDTTHDNMDWSCGKARGSPGSKGKAESKGKKGSREEKDSKTGSSEGKNNKERNSSNGSREEGKSISSRGDGKSDGNGENKNASSTTRQINGSSSIFENCATVLPSMRFHVSLGAED